MRQQTFFRACSSIQCTMYQICTFQSTLAVKSESYPRIFIISLKLPLFSRFTITSLTGMERDILPLIKSTFEYWIESCFEFSILHLKNGLLKWLMKSNLNAWAVLTVIYQSNFNIRLISCWQALPLINHCCFLLVIVLTRLTSNIPNEWNSSDMVFLGIIQCITTIKITNNY